LKSAVEQGLVSLDEKQHPVLTESGKSTLGVATSAAPATPAEPAAPKKDEPKDPADTLASFGGDMLLVRNVLQVATATKMPHPLTLYFLATGLDRVMGHKVLPPALQSGKPMRDLADFGLIGYMTYMSSKEIPGAVRQFKSSLASQQAVAGARPSMLNAMISRIKEAPPAATAGTPAPAPSSPAPSVPKPAGESIGGWMQGMKGLSAMIQPLFYAGFTVLSASDILRFAERTREKGTHGLVKTAEGRGALFGAASGALTIAALYLPKSPLSVLSDVASMGFWIAQAVNDKGWLDPLLGGDPKATSKDVKPGETPTSL
jgi:hypothetical protein